MTKVDSQHIEASVLEEAARWRTKLTSGSATDADIAGHMEWLLEDPAHILADETVAATINQASEFETAARTTFASDFVIDDEIRTDSAGWRRWFDVLLQPQYAAVALATFLFVAVAPSLGLFDTATAPHHYMTQDEVRSFTLEDGSSIALFANSEISVRMDEDARQVQLTKGRAFFDVTSNKARPFYVNTGLRQVTVVGTRFEVMRTETYDRVAVNEGLVSVNMIEADEEGNAPTLVQPGTVALYEEDSVIPTLSEKEASAIGAWAEGVLVFREAPVSEVLVAINELFPSYRLSVVDEKLATMSFSGTLVVSTPEQMARQLGAFLALDVQVDGTEIRLASN